MDASPTVQDLCIPDDVQRSLLTITSSSKLQEALGSLTEISKTEAGRSDLASKLILPRVLQLVQCIDHQSASHLLLSSLRLLRNLCAGDAENQNLFIEHNGVETVLAVIKAARLSCDNSVFGVVRASLQVLANVSLAGEKQQRAIWHHCFPVEFVEIAKGRIKEIADPLSMIIYACVDECSELFSELCELDRLTIIAEIVRTASVDGFGEDWLKLLLSRLCLENPCFAALFRALSSGDGPSEKSEDTAEIGYGCYTPEQAFLLGALSEIVHERIKEVQVRKELAIHISSIFRKAVGGVDFTARGQSALPTGCTITDILGFSLAILRDTCAQGPLPSSGSCEDREDVVNALVSVGLLDMLLALLRELEPPSQIRKTIRHTEDQPPFHSAKVCPYKGFRRDIVAVIGNLAFLRKHVQDEIREKNAIFLLLQQCVLDDDNPFLREWGMWTIRNLLEGNADNHQALSDLELQGIIDAPELTALGLRVEVDSNTRRAKLVNV